MSFIGRSGTVDITVPANQSLAVGSPAGGQTRIYYGTTYSAGNLPTAFALQAVLTSASGLYGPFAAAQAVRIEATNGGEVEYVTGAQPTLTGLGAPPTLNFKNMLDGGDFTVNPFQRNIPGLASAGVIASAIANVVTYFADRFFGVGGASSAILFSKVADTSVPGFSSALKFQRQSANANTAVINMGQVLETADSVHLQGLPVTLSFWAKAGANYSGGNLNVQLFTGTGTNDTAANMVAGSWAGSATPINTSQALTTTMTRYQFTGTIAATATQVGVLFGYTPVGTAGSDDSVTFHGLQLEVGSSASAFEHRDAQVELEICQRYAWVTAEPASGVVVGMGACPTTTTASIYMATPVQMYKAPTLTVSAGSFNVRPANAAASGTAAAGTTHTANAITVSVTSVTATTAGFATPLLGGAGSGYIVASADF